MSLLREHFTVAQESSYAVEPSVAAGAGRSFELKAVAAQA